jgi:phage portal protein BeeE
LLAASREARSHILGTEHNVQILERGGRVSLVFHFDEDLDEDDFEKLKARVREQYGGAGKAGEIGVTSGPGMTIRDVGVNPKDMDFGNLHEVAQNSVAMVYRVPLPLVTASRQTLNNYLAAKTALYDDAVLPLSRRILGGLADFLFPRFDLDPNRATLLINHDDVSALVTRRNDELLKRSRLRVETDNEIRAILGREPYAGGDVVYKDASQIPAGSDVFTDDNDPTLLADNEDGE